MCFPIMNKQPRRNVNIPDLAGGVNYRDGITEVHDNQLTECKNMWFKDGVLRTRPAAVCNETSELVKQTNGETYNHETKVFKEIVFNYGGKKYLLVCVHQRASDKNDTLWFYWVGEKENRFLGTINTSSKDVSFFVTVSKKTLYCFVSNYEIYKCTEWSYDGTESDAWQEVSEDEIYAPIVLTNCKTAGDKKQSSSDLILNGAVQLEGYNLITSKYTMVYSTFNKELLSNNDTDHVMAYSLLYNAHACIAQDILGHYSVVAEITNSKGQTYKHSVRLLLSSFVGGDMETESPGDDLYMRVIGYFVQFFEKTSDGFILARISEDEYVENNLKITANFPESPSERKKRNNKVFSMARATWFGGASEGINGGTRLFLGGNTAEDEESLVVWSDLNNPLYFPENAYAYVGNTTSAVTGFGKQSDMLVIFKENETYFTQYRQNTDITADDLIDQTVIDYASSNVFFPLTLINANIGCDIPDTVELCRNRLVWTNSNGKVYTLTANNQYSERNVYEVGEMVERKLKQLNLKHASACDFAGYYVLFAEGKAYLMDYNSNGYQYVYSYNKNDDAQKNIPWYEWEFSVTKNSSVSTDGVRLYILDISDTDGGKKIFFYEVSESAEEDVEETEYIEPAFASSFTTKAFDFGSAGYRKNVDVVKLFLGNNGGAPIKVEFVTDCGTVSEEIILDSPETENYTAGYVSTVSLAPPIRSIVRMALRVSSEGKLAVDGAELTYRILGGAR